MVESPLLLKVSLREQESLWEKPNGDHLKRKMSAKNEDMAYV
jgi:hypothetical protein